MRSPAPLRSVAVLAALFALIAVSPPPLLAAPDLSDREAAQLKQQITEAAGKSEWDRVGDLMERLAAANDKETWKFLVRVTESAPPTSDCGAKLRLAAQAMTDRKVQDEVRKTALKSRAPQVRRQLVGHLAVLQDWPALIELVGDADEQVASVAAWKLIDNRVEAAVEPMIAEMEKLDRTHAGIWDVLRNGLGQLLGQRLESGVEYRSRWTVVKGQGGLTSVARAAGSGEATGGNEGGNRSAVRLFGRSIDSTRVVFILDTSGSMLAVDPGQDAPDPSSTTRPPQPGTQPGGGAGGPPGAPQGKNRMVRAKEELKRVLQALPETIRVNIVAYSTNVQLWKAGEGDAAPQLHPMNAANKKDALEFVDAFEANGVTVTDDAIDRAFTVEGARCFYLLSDGAPTHDGTTPVPTDEIIRKIDAANGDRHVTIHTLGFVGADRQMMQAVAEHTGGKYSDIK